MKKLFPLWFALALPAFAGSVPPPSGLTGVAPAGQDLGDVSTPALVLSRPLPLANAAPLKVLLYMKCAGLNIWPGFPSGGIDDTTQRVRIMLTLDKGPQFGIEIPKSFFYSDPILNGTPSLEVTDENIKVKANQYQSAVDANLITQSPLSPSKDARVTDLAVKRHLILADVKLSEVAPPTIAVDGSYSPFALVHVKSIDVCSVDTPLAQMSSSCTTPPGPAATALRPISPYKMTWDFRADYTLRVEGVLPGDPRYCSPAPGPGETVLPQ